MDEEEIKCQEETMEIIAKTKEKSVIKKHSDLAKLANNIVNKIVADLTDRIDGDIRSEIEEKWNDIVYEELAGRKA